MSYEVITKGLKTHSCDKTLPDPDDYQHKTVIRCSCGQYFQCDYWGRSFWNEISEWKANRLLKKAHKEKK